jgi:hypothetical protein
MRTLRRLGMLIATGMLATLAVAPAAAASTPSIDRIDYHQVYVAPGLSAACGFQITRDQSDQGVDAVYSDGSERQDIQEVDIWSANGKSITEHDAFSVFIAVDGTVTLSGANYHAIQPGTGLIVIDGGRLAWDPNGDLIVLDGPHPVVLDGRAPTFCGALAP